MQRIEEINAVLNDIVWGPYMLVFLVGVGVYFTLRLKVFQISKIGVWGSMTFGKLFKKQTAGEGAVTPFQALTTALAATVGTGNMVGVATAIVLGGPGAVFWMWVSAFFGMMTKFAEIVLSLRFRRRNNAGDWVGGPMYYIAEARELVRGDGRSGARNMLSTVFRPLAYLFAIFGALAAFGIGNMTQINSISSSIETLMSQLGVVEASEGFTVFKLLVGVVLAVLVALVTLGGLKRIGQVTERLVPFMCVVFIIGGIGALALNAAQIGPAFKSIIEGAFRPQALGGGLVGYTIAGAMRYGIARGVFSNEAGLGSAPIAHAAAESDHPVKQGLWGVFEVFMDTLVICTFTSLVVLTSGAYTGPETVSGSPLTIAAFQNSYGLSGTFFVTLCITLFAFSTVLSWSLYGQRCFEFITRGRGINLYKIVFILAIVVAAVMELELAWNIADTLNGLMAIPNLIGLVVLSGVVAKLTKEYLDGRKAQKE